MDVMVQTNCRDACIVNCTALHFGMRSQPGQGGPMLRRFSDKTQAWRFGLNIDLSDGLFQSGRRIKYFRTRHDRYEFVYARPRYGPSSAARGKHVQTGMRRLVPLVVSAMSVDQEVGIDRDHR